jgi:hypothetical protein
VRILDTAAEDWGKRHKMRGRSFSLQGRSVVVFQLQAPTPPKAAAEGR